MHFVLCPKQDSSSLIPKYIVQVPPPPFPWEAETDTILKTEKPLGRGDQRPLEQERSPDCDKSRTESDNNKISEAYFAC